MLLRYQDLSGRGPWRPGFSHKWQDEMRRFDLPALQEDFGFDLQPMVYAAFRRGLHIGTALRGWGNLKIWFTPKEMTNLALLGFYIADCSGCEVLGETQYQAVIGSAQPLSEMPRVSMTELAK